MARRTGSFVVLQRDGTVLYRGLPVGHWCHDYVPFAQCDYQLRWWAQIGGEKTKPRLARKSMVRDIEAYLSIVEVKA